MKQKTLNTTVSENESKHTPGEWEIRKFSIWAIGDNHFPIKICDLPEDGREFYEDEANARLIAAAPDMLEALMILDTAALIVADEMNTASPDKMEDMLAAFHNAHLKARSAIAKATNNQ